MDTRDPDFVEDTIDSLTPLHTLPGAKEQNSLHWELMKKPRRHLKKTLASILALILLIGYLASQSFGWMSFFISKKFDAPAISVGTLKNMDRKSYTLLDARETIEFKVSHIPSSLHIGYKNFDLLKVRKILSKTDKVIVYCSVGYRSGEIASLLRKEGYDAINLRGGIFEWSNRKYPLVDAQENPTQKIHGYDRGWAKWLTSGDVTF